MRNSLLIILSVFFLLCFSGDTVSSINFSLKDYCPPGFENTDAGCKNRNLYQQYKSLYDEGVGGLKTSLPKVIDGFTPQQIDLGRYLFFDPILSKDNTIACASCHNPNNGFTDGRNKSRGVGGVTKRSAPSLWNVAFLDVLNWDGSSASHFEQLEGPLFDPIEMGNTEEILISRLNSNSNYKLLFDKAFPAGNGEITLDELKTALVAFESSLISLNSRYDQYAHGYKGALSENEIKGMNVFRSFVARCAECHTPPLFTNRELAVIGVPDKGEFDEGAGGISKDPTMKGSFKVPTLRNVTKTAPYMHAGNHETLREAVAFYNKGRGHAVKDLGLYLHWHIHEPDLTDEEIDRIVDFLYTLEDEYFIPEIPHKLPSGLDPVISNTIN